VILHVAAICRPRSSRASIGVPRRYMYLAVIYPGDRAGHISVVGHLRYFPCGYILPVWQRYSYGATAASGALTSGFRGRRARNPGCARSVKVHTGIGPGKRPPVDRRGNRAGENESGHPCPPRASLALRPLPAVAPDREAPVPVVRRTDNLTRDVVAERRDDGNSGVSGAAGLAGLLSLRHDYLWHDVVCVREHTSRTRQIDDGSAEKAGWGGRAWGARCLPRPFAVTYR